MAIDNEARRQSVRDVAIGAVAALGVTVVGGVLVYYLTRSPQPVPAHEQLVFSVQPITAFSTENASIGFTTIIARNVGSVAAHSVRLVIDAGPDTRIRDRRITLSSGAAGTYSISDTSSGRLALAIPVFAASEQVKIGLLLDRPGDVPTVSIKSDASIGALDAGERPVAGGMLAGIINNIPFYLGCLGLLQVLLYLLMRNLRENTTYDAAGARNNAGFLLLHSGQPDEAASHFKGAINSHGANDSHPFANLSLALELTGDSLHADQMLVAAAFYARTAHQKALVAFNRGLVEFNRGQIEKGQRALVEALRQSKKEVSRYLGFSQIVKLQRVDPRIDVALRAVAPDIGD